MNAEELIGLIFKVAGEALELYAKLRKANTTPADVEPADGLAPALAELADRARQLRAAMSKVAAAVPGSGTVPALDVPITYAEVDDESH